MTKCREAACGRFPIAAVCENFRRFVKKAGMLAEIEEVPNSASVLTGRTSATLSLSAAGDLDGGKPVGWRVVAVIDNQREAAVFAATLSAPSVYDRHASGSA